MSTRAPRALGRSAGIVAGATLASRVLGLLRDLVVAVVFGASAGTDAFFIAFMIPNLLRRLVGEGSLTVSLVPVLSGWLERGRAAARDAFSAISTLGLLVAAAATALGIVFADPLISIFAGGFAEVPGQHALAVELLRWCFPYIFFLVGVALAMGALNASDHFLAPAAAPVLLNVCLITAAGLAFALAPDAPAIRVLAVAVPIAGALQLALQLGPLRRHQLVPAPRWQPAHPAALRVGRMMLPAVLGASVFQINLVVSRTLASWEGPGAISYLYYADRLIEFPLGVFVFAVGTASLPALARAVRAGGDALGRAFRDALGLALALAVPSALGLVWLRVELFGVLFAWNPETFGSDAVLGCAAALLWYALGLVPITLSRSYVNLCVANENTATGARGAVVGVIVNLVCALALIGPLPDHALPAALVSLQHALVVADLGYAGLAAASSIASLANAAYVGVAAHRRYGALLGARDLLGFARIAAATAGMGLGLWALAAVLPIGQEASLAALARLTLHVVCGAGLYGACLAALGAPEVRAVLGLLPGRR